MISRATGKKIKIMAIVLPLLIAAIGTASAFTDQEQLGRELFFDTNLSEPAGQGCVSCHDPASGFADPDSSIAVSEGATPGRFGSRNAPTAAYHAFTPDFAFVGGEFVGGEFWDQRAANLTEQAKAPFLNRLEMNNTDEAGVLNKIINSTYKGLFNMVCGQPDMGNLTDVKFKYTCMASAIAAFENTPELNNFSSEFDLYPADMTVQEKRGLFLFSGKGNCAICHPIAPIPSRSLFTDFDSHNTGVPSNLGMMGNNMTELQAYYPFYFFAPEFNPDGLNFTDVGVAGNPNVPQPLRPGVRGAFKAPTLRNVELTAPYMHNGVFRTLKEVVHFYNTRDLLGNCANTTGSQPGVNCWPLPEVPQNLDPIPGNLELTDTEENDIVAFLLTLTDGYVPEPQASVLTDKEQLGKNLFSDVNLSTPQGQSCQSCHDPAASFTDLEKDRGVSEGATPGRFGNRNAPSTAYAAFSPNFFFNGVGFIGGQFWNQRAANLTEQARGPFLNSLEMNNSDEAEVLNKINNSAYAFLFNTVCGNRSYPDGQYTCMAEAIAAFENTPEMNNFSSKFDLDQANMTLEEMKGFNLFNGKGKCVVCHPLGPFASSTLFTDFDAENIGVPSNLGMLAGNTTALQHYFPFYFLAPEFNPAGVNFVDIGMAGNPNVPEIMRPQVRGAQKAPTLRNVNLTAPYMHNGVFRTLKEVVHFYNTRDVLGNCAVRTNPQPGVNCWPAAEVLQNMNTVIGNLQLTDAEENEIVSFLKTLTDGYVPEPGASGLTPQEQLGKNLFSDTNLSTPPGQGCISCHDPAAGFTDLEKDRAASGGIIPGRFGSRNSPSAAYQAFAPDFHLGGPGFIGGQFWDQRAANLTEQAKGPFLNPLEMNNPDNVTVLNKIQNSTYVDLFNQVCGQPDTRNLTDVELKYTCMASAIAAFEKTPELNRFSSKFDIDKANLTVQEMRGFNLFNGKGKCAVCHPRGPFRSLSLFTDFDAENIGVPKNMGMMGDTPALKYYFPFYYMPEFNPAGSTFVDTGVAGNPAVPPVMRPTLRGVMKAPTLRNVELTAPYMHNGVFMTLKEVVHFYNTRDILGNCAVVQNPQPGVNCWPAPEVSANLALGVGNLQLTDAEENDIVAYLLTLTDGFGSQQGGNIMGRVTNAVTGAPVRAAVVTAGTRTALTGAGGGYTITNIAPGNYTVTVNATGFGLRNAAVSAASGTTVGQDFGLQPSAPAQVNANITGFNVENGIRGGKITANVTVKNLNSVSHWYIVVVSGTNQRGYPLAGTGVVRLNAEESIRIPVQITVPPSSDTGSYSMFAGVYPFDDEILIPARLIGNLAGPGFTTVT